MPRQLYSYFRSSAAYRVRIALALKGLDYETVPIHLIKDGGQQHSPAYLQVNPQGRVPTFVDDDRVLTQSLAIIEYLDERYPHSPLLPADCLLRAHVRSFAQLIACDIHPLNNSGVLRYLSTQLSVSETQKTAWIHHWIQAGFHTLEHQLAHRPESDFAFGDTPGLADCCLVPQAFNALRYGYDLPQHPRLNKIYLTALQHPAFIAAAPENQIDSE